MSTGSTLSASFPTTIGAYDTVFQGPLGDAVRDEVQPRCSSLVYSTFLGATVEEGGRGIRVDTDGTALVTGRTSSPDFPTTDGAFSTDLQRHGRGFLTRFNATGSALVFSTYLGGSGADYGNTIELATDGRSWSPAAQLRPTFPVTPGAF